MTRSRLVVLLAAAVAILPVPVQARPIDTIPHHRPHDALCAGPGPAWATPQLCPRWHRPPPPPPPAPVATPAPVPAPVSSGALPACTWVGESGGSYTAVNPTSGAYGKYQIMPLHYGEDGICSDLSTSPADQETCASRIYATSGASAWVNC